VEENNMAAEVRSKSQKGARWSAGTVVLVVVCVWLAVMGFFGIREAIEKQTLADSLPVALVIALCIAVWVGLAWAVGQYAKRKGCNPTGVCILSLLLSPVLGFIVVAVMKPNERKAAAAEGKKQCPMCAEFVQAEARICRYCQHRFEEKLAA
jgi:cytochrome bd-type quinol oxidase subunit 2